METGIQPPALVRVGQWTSFIAFGRSCIVGPHLIGKFASLVAYYQEFSSYLAPPIVGTVFSRPVLEGFYSQRCICRFNVGIGYVGINHDL